MQTGESLRALRSLGSLWTRVSNRIDEPILAIFPCESLRTSKALSALDTLDTLDTLRTDRSD